MSVLACVKWVDLRPHGHAEAMVEIDVRTAGFSDADLSAVELAARLAETRKEPLSICCVGPEQAANSVAELAATVGGEPVLVAVAQELTSRSVGHVIADAIRSLGQVNIVVCGDYSLDRGSGAVPAYVAAAAEMSWCHGVVEVEDAEHALLVRRRLDGGAREVLEVSLPTVLAVEGAVRCHGEAIRLRRASANALLNPPSPTVLRGIGDHRSPRYAPPRIPTSIVAPPHGDPFDRLVQLAGTRSERSRHAPIHLDPTTAAGRILGALREWGYLD